MVYHPPESPRHEQSCGCYVTSYHDTTPARYLAALIAEALAKGGAA